MLPFESTIAGAPSLREHEETADREAQFAAFVHLHTRFIFRVAYAILRNRHDSEDVVQETFLRLFRSRAWQSMKDERAFLARTTYRLALDRLPKRAFDTLDTELPSLSPGPEQSAIDTNQDHIIHRLIDALPENLRQVLVLSAIEELNSRQIAAILNEPEGTIRTRLMRARQILREKLERTSGGLQ